jgi:putative component of membrane protein insertase Oxa1/YidC/SpoIIIJ protein YidD
LDFPVHLARRVIVGTLAIASRVRTTQPRLDRVLTALAVLAIRTYQATLSPWIGQDCYFRPSCSRRTLAAIRALGWSRAIGPALDHIQECGAGYSLARGVDGGMLMFTASGRLVPEDEIAERILAAHAAPPGPGHSGAP